MDAEKVSFWQLFHYNTEAYKKENKTKTLRQIK